MANGGVNQGDRGKPREKPQAASSLNESSTGKVGRGFMPSAPDSVLELSIEDVLQQPLPEIFRRKCLPGRGSLHWLIFYR